MVVLCLNGMSEGADRLWVKDGVLGLNEGKG